MNRFAYALVPLVHAGAAMVPAVGRASDKQLSLAGKWHWSVRVHDVQIAHGDFTIHISADGTADVQTGRPSFP